MAEANLSKEVTEQQVSQEETAKLEFAAERQADATEEENDMGDRADLPIDKKKVLQRGLHKKSQPLEKLDGVIEEIRKLMLRSIESVSKEDLNIGECSRVAGK
jgi:hypothetical protein